MILKLTIISDEAEDFGLQLLIDSNATFYELHQAILKACHYEEGFDHRFYVCDEDWQPEHRIFLTDCVERSSDYDIDLMQDAMLGDYLEDEGQRLTYRFDPTSRRILLIELTETLFRQSEPEPRVLRCRGNAPQQILMDEEEAKPAQTKSTPQTDIDETFYGDESFDSEEFDTEGFDILEG